MVAQEKMIRASRPEQTQNRKKFFLNVTLSFIQILLLMGMVWNLTNGIESMYQINRDIYFYRAVSFFCVELFLLRRTRLYRFPFLIAILGYGFYFVRIMRGYTVELYGEKMAECKSVFLIALGLFLLLLVDIIISWKETPLRFSSRWYGAFSLIALAVAFILNFQVTRPVIFPVMALLLTPLTEKEWKSFATYLTVGYYLAFIWIYTCSLIQVPPVGKNLYTNRLLYLGTFFNYSTEGAFCAGAFLCAFYLFLIYVGKKNKWGIGFSVLAMLYSFTAVVFCGERSSMFAVVIIVLLSYLFMNLKKEEERQKRKITIFLCIVAVLLISFVVLLLVAGKISDETEVEIGNILDKVTNERISSYVSQIINRGKQIYRFDSKLGYLPDGSILNPLDWLTSGRVSYWIDSIKRTTWFGSNDVAVQIGKKFDYHPHSAYLTWLRWYGWIGGSVVITWFLTTVVITCRRLINQEREVLFSFLWSVYIALFGIGEMVLWTYPAGFLFLIMLYPILFRFQDPEILQ